MMKLPLLLLDLKLYGGAIAQFYVLTRTLEEEIEKHASHPLVAHVRTSVGLKPLAPGYAADLAQIFGDAWADAVVAARTPATEEYVAALRRAGRRAGRGSVHSLRRVGGRGRQADADESATCVAWL